MADEIKILILLSLLSGLFWSCEINSPVTEFIEEKIESDNYEEEEIPEVRVTGVVLNTPELTITGIGNTVQLTATVSPAEATDPSVSWSSSDGTVTTVDSEGLVTAESTGTATITVTTTDGGYAATCDVTVEEEAVPVTGVTLNESASTLTGAGETLQLTATVSPSDATDKSVNWSSSNEAVATVNSSGLVTAGAEGTALITVTTVSGGHNASCAVTVDYIYDPGDQQIFSVSGISFSLVYVPGGLAFPTGVDDAGDGNGDGDLLDTGIDDPDGEETVTGAYWIAETELTYKLWYTVKDWAENTASPAYTFRTTDSREGSDGIANAAPSTNGDETKPVTRVYWADAVIFCNALTEWYNDRQNTTYSCVYTDGGTPVRNALSVTTPTTEAASDGFRLPTAPEWELAARWKGANSADGAVEYPASSGRYWYPGNYASGATDTTSNSTATDLVAWYNNSVGATQRARGKNQNLLGLYDMGGNAYEFTASYGETTSDRILKGGSFNSVSYSAGNGYVIFVGTSSISTSYSFRLARMADG